MQNFALDRALICIKIKYPVSWWPHLGRVGICHSGSHCPLRPCLRGTLQRPLLRCVRGETHLGRVKDQSDPRSAMGNFHCSYLQT